MDSAPPVQALVQVLLLEARQRLAQRRLETGDVEQRAIGLKLVAARGDFDAILVRMRLTGGAEVSAQVVRGLKRGDDPDFEHHALPYVRTTWTVSSGVESMSW